MQDLDRAFASFARSGDAAALGRAYDLAAGELLALATRLCGDPVEAEDLVQATFVAAIESARDFATGRRAMPWLIGILTHRVLRWRRARQVRVPLSQPGGSAPGPLDLLANQELQQRVAEALAGISPVLHPVLVLRLRHGMQPAEIAYALGRPPATVRSQLARGLEQLRSRLPKELALPAVMVLPLPRGLAAVRDAVLAHGSGHAASLGAASTFAGVMLMAKTTWWSVASLAVLVLGGLWWWQPWQDEPRVPQPEATVAAHGAAAGANATDPGAQGAAMVEALTQRRAEVVTAMRVTVLGLGRPVPGACVELTPRASAALRRGITDDRGTVLFDALPNGVGTCSLPGCITSFGGNLGSDYKIDEGTTGELVLDAPAPGFVQGRVLRASETPIPGARVWVGQSGGQSPAVRTRETVLAGPDGSFRMALWSDAILGASAEGTVPALREVAVTAGQTLEVVLHLGDGGASLRGRVIAALDERPLAGAAIEVGDRFGDYLGRLKADGSRESVLPVTVTCDAEGRFEVGGLLPGPVTVHAVADGFAATSVSATLPRGGGSEVVLRLDRGGTLRGVVTRSDGKPAHHAEVRAGEDSRFSTVSTHADIDGHYELQHLAAGAMPLTARMAGWGQASSSLVIEPGVTAGWNPVLDPQWDAITGTLRDDTGQPLGGWWVVVHSGSRFDAGSPVRAATDGRFTARLGHQLTTCELRVHPPCDPAGDGRPAAQAVWMQPGVSAGARDLDLVVPARVQPTAWLHGRFEQLDRSSGGPLLVGEAGSRRALPIEADGAFRIGPLTPGRWRILLPGLTQEPELAAFELLPREQKDLGVLTARQPERGAIEIELPPARLPADFRLEFEGDGAVQVLTADDQQFVRWLQLHLDAARRARLSLLPGRYLLRLCAVPLAPSPQLVEVRAGETARVVFPPRPAALRRVAFGCAGAGQASGELAVEVRDAADAVTWSTRVTAANGWWQCELNLEPGTYRLRARAAEWAAQQELIIEAAELESRPMVIMLEPPR